MSDFEEGAFARFVVVESDFNGLDFAREESLEEFLGEAVGAVGGGNGFHAVTVESESVDERFAQDHFTLLKGFGVEDAAMRSRKVEVFGCAFAESFRDFAAIEFGDLVVSEDGDDD